MIGTGQPIERTIETERERLFHSRSKAAFVSHVTIQMSSQHLAVPLTLQSISPTLAAFHVNRMGRHVRSGGEEEEKEEERVIDDLENTHCPRCRRFQLDGSADTRLVRDNKHRSTSVILQKSCGSCGFTRRSPLVKRGPILFQNQRKRNQQISNLNPPGTKSEVEGNTQPGTRIQTPPIAPAPPQFQVTEPAASTSDGPKKPKNRKARSGLQEMLERKRKQDQAKSAGTTLASFLQGL